MKTFSALLVTIAGMLGVVLMAGCNSSTADPCAGVKSGCLAVTVSSATIKQLDTLSVSATGAFSGTHDSTVGHAESLPIRFRVTYPASASGSVRLDVVGKLAGAAIGDGSGSVTIKPGANETLSLTLVGQSSGGGNDLAMQPGSSSDMSSSDMAASGSLTDMKLGADMYRETLAFTAKGPFATGATNPRSIAVGNFQGKGIVDVVVGGTMAGSLFLQDATGSYPATPSATYSPNATISGIGVGRWFTGATKQDFVIDDRFTLQVLDNNNAGVFTMGTYPSSFELGMSPGAIAVGDFNADNADDLAVALATDGTGPAIAIIPSAGNGSFQQNSATMPPPTYLHPGEALIQLAAGELTTAGKIDVVATMGTNHLLVLHGNGAGAFTFDATADKHTVGSSPAFIAIADFDGNHKNDIAVANNGGSVSILLNDGSGGFPATGTLVSAGMGPNGIVAADFDGDGAQDLAVTDSQSTTVSILLGDGAGHFAAPAPFTVGSAPSAIAVTDLNADNKPDLLVANQADGTFTVLINASH